MFTSSLSTLHSKLQKKQEELRRLNEIKPQLVGLNLEFISNLSNCMEPGLSSDTWAGKMAGNFNDTRELQVQGNYTKILSEQFPLLLAVLETKIKDIMNDIDDLYKAIAEAEEKEKQQKEAKE
ncbi:YwqH-like family protein [Metabacillus fastidiosus]|uniref:YwqH-like family protein n=1 Tax=Metabacillus fastidiosus TaxID=1458 RepID=UPI003D26658C